MSLLFYLIVNLAVWVPLDPLDGLGNSRIGNLPELRHSRRHRNHKQLASDSKWWKWNGCSTGWHGMDSEIRNRCKQINYERFTSGTSIQDAVAKWRKVLLRHNPSRMVAVGMQRSSSGWPRHLRIPSSIRPGTNSKYPNKLRNRCSKLIVSHNPLERYEEVGKKNKKKVVLP